MDDEEKNAVERRAELAAAHARDFEQRLAESERLLSLTEELAGIGSWRIDLVAERLHWSEAVYRIHGLTPESYAPDLATAIGFYHPDDREYVQKAVAEAIENCEAFKFVLRIVRSDGAVRQVESRGIPEANDDGKVHSVVGIFRDITEQLEAEEERRRSHERLRIHVEHTPLAVIEWDTDFRVVEWNARAEEIFGYTRSEALGRHAADLVVPRELRDAINEVFARLLSQTGGVHSTNENITKDGRVITCEWSNTTLLDSDGAPLGVASICQDITERKLLEEQLLHSQKMEAIGTLAGGVAHDMNNILAAILGFGTVVEDELPPDSPLRVDMQELIAAARRGRSTVDNLLGFARKGAYVRTLCTPQVIVDRLVQLLRKTIPKSIEIEANVQEPVGSVLGDADQITTALMNLCINAAQAITGHGTVAIRADSVAIAAGGVPELPGLAPGEYVRLQVIDDGIGMDAETRERVFEPFFTTKALGEGTGLGLSMVYGAAESHGGAVTVESTLGEGTTFSMLFPSVQADEVATEERAPATVSVSRSILVIDDEEMILRAARRTLERAGHRVTVARGGEVGLEALRSREGCFDLVILDFSMPRMNGAECYAELRRLDSEVPVLICTGHGDPMLTAEVVKAGASGVLTKPFDKDALSRKVAEVLGQEARKA